MVNSYFFIADSCYDIVESSSGTRPLRQAEKRRSFELENGVQESSSGHPSSPPAHPASGLSIQSVTCIEGMSPIKVSI